MPSVFCPLDGRPARLAAVRGFTLVELMVTVAVAAVLLAIAVPSFTSIVNSSRLTAQANEVVAALQSARMEAVRRNARVSVCSSADGSTCAGPAEAWGSLLTVLESSGEVLRVNAVKPSLKVSSGVSKITFRADGLARDAAGAVLANTVTVCIPTTRPAENQRLVEMASGSRISAKSKDGSGACP